MVARRYATSPHNYFDLFPKAFPNGGPPADPFQINLRLLRREYRSLQSENHPDIVMGASALDDGAKSDDVGSDGVSADINRAYSTIRNAYTRAAYVIQLHHPDHLDITQDEVAKELIAHFQADSQEYSLDYKMLLMTVLEAHESLELALSEADLEALSLENDDRIAETLLLIEQMLEQKPIVWDDVIIEAIRMKYWVNIATAIRDWEPGKPVHLTH